MQLANSAVFIEGRSGATVRRVAIGTRADGTKSADSGVHQHDITAFAVDPQQKRLALGYQVSRLDACHTELVLWY